MITEILSITSNNVLEDGIVEEKDSYKKHKKTELDKELINKVIRLMNSDLLESEKKNYTFSFNRGISFMNNLSNIENEKKTLNKEKDSKLNNSDIKLKILYIEDDANSRMVVSLFLRNDFDISIVNNASAALEITDKNKFDLILMDINLGFGMNGLELAQILRKKEHFAEIPIAAVTANAMVGDKDKYLTNGCSHYISKPFSKATLVSFIKAIFEDKS